MHRNRLWVGLLMAALGLLTTGFCPAISWGQSVTSASINGKVLDESGASVANAKISVTSPALQVPEVTATSDSEGDYKILDLPAPGVYRIAFTANGFQTYVRGDVTLSVGVAARVDGVMKVGAITQSVEVSGENPVVDTVTTAGSTTLQQADIQEIPRGQGLQEMLPMAAGVSLQGKPDVGDSNLAARSAVITYGVILQPTLEVEGINTTTNKDADTAVYLDSFAIAEAEFKTSGNNADVAFPGVAQVVVMKSGSNTFHGDASADYENVSFQANNISAALAAPPNNLKVSNQLADPGYYDYAFDLGGRIIRDRLWAYGGYSKQSVTQGQPNFFGGPSTAGCWISCVGPQPVPANVISSLPQFNIKVSYQLKPSTKIIFSDLHGNKFLSANGASSTVPLPATMYEQQPDSSWHGEVQSAPSSRLLIDALFGHGGYHTTYTDQPASTIGQFGYTKGSDFAGSPSEEELSTKSFTGPHPFPQNRPQNRYEMRATVSFIPSQPHFGGTHQLKWGTVDDWEIAGTRVEQDKLSGDYLLLFQNGLPSQITLYNYPFPNSINHLYSQAGFMTDTWTIKRVTLNLGVRGERYHSYYPTQDKVPGQFSNIFPAQTFNGVDILTWVDVVPRIGAAWDVRGDGKTVVKGSFGKFGDTMGDLFATTFNLDAQQANTYTWTGPCGPTAALAPIQYNCDVTPAFLATITPATKPISQTGGLSQVPNPSLKQDQTYEVTAKIERQLVPNVAINATYVYHRLYNMYDAATNGTGAATASFSGNGINVGHPYNDWTVPVVFNDTFNGVTTPVTVYTYPAGTGPTACDQTILPLCTANEVLNNPSSRPDYYHSFEIGVTKRYSKRWDGLASFWMTKDHRWLNGLAGIAGSPNDSAFPIDNTWNWEARGSVAYHLPKGFQVTSLFRAQSGTPGQRTSAFNSAALRQGSTTIRMGAYGDLRGPVIDLLNVKVAKEFVVHERWHFEANFQVFNILNSNASVTTTYLTGSTFGVVSSILSPRVARIGGVFSF